MAIKIILIVVMIIIVVGVFVFVIIDHKNFKKPHLKQQTVEDYEDKLRNLGYDTEAIKDGKVVCKNCGSSVRFIKSCVWANTGFYDAVGLGYAHGFI